MTAGASRPRIPPLPPQERVGAVRELLDTATVAGSDANIFTTLARAPGLFRRWLPFGGKLLSGKIPARERELLILRTGWNCRSEYEWAQHVRIGLSAGLTSDEIARVPTGPHASGWDAFDATLLRATDELHENFRVADLTWDALAERYDTQQLIELPMLVGHYHLVAMTLNTLGVALDEGLEGFPVGRTPPTGTPPTGTPPTGKARGRPPSPTRAPRAAMTTGRLLDGRRVIVVGAGTRPAAGPDAPPGNGRAISVLAGREGAAVACFDLDGEAARATARLVEAEGARAMVIAGDASDPATAAAAVEQTVAELGGLDGVVLNVGIARGSGLRNTTAEDWDTTFAVNVRAHFLFAQAALPAMGPGSAIVFISSVAGLKPGSRIPSYDTSKAALAGLSRHVAAEGARREIRANVVAPGLIDTPLGRLASAGRPSRERTPVPLGRQGMAFEVAEAVVWLLSHRASYVTGQVLAVDGGLSTLM